MADRNKRQRTATTSSLRITEPKPAAAPKPPPPHLLGRTCRLRLVHESDAWLKGTLLAYSGNHKQTCEIELDGGEAAARRVEKVHLSTQPVHVLDEVVWGPEQGAASAEGQASASVVRRRSMCAARGRVPMRRVHTCSPVSSDCASRSPGSSASSSGGPSGVKSSMGTSPAT